MKHRFALLRGLLAARSLSFSEPELANTVQKPLFSVRCTTCQAVLGVHDLALVGQLVDCPKCGSFVEVVPPKGWTTPAEGVVASQAAEAAAVGPAVTPSASDSSPPTGPAKSSKHSAGAAPPVSAEALAAQTVAVAVPLPPLPPVVNRPPPTVSVPAAVALGLPPAAEVQGAPPESPVMPAVTAEGAALAEGMSLWTKTAIALSMTAVLLLTAVLVRDWTRSKAELIPIAGMPEVAEDPPPTEKAPEVAIKPTTIDLRWVPDSAKLLFRAQASVSLTQREGSQYLEQFGSPWHKTFATALKAMQLKPEAVGHLMLVSTDLAVWPAKSVLVIELAEGQDAAALDALCRPAGFTLYGAECRRLASGAWPHPLAVIDGKTIVTGDEALLRQLADRGEAAIASAPMGRLLKAVAPDADATLLIDLSAARQAGWKLPEGLFDVWPAGRAAWRTIWDLAEGLGCMVRCTAQAGAELALVCDGESAAEKVYHAIGELTPAAKESLAASVAGIAKKVEAGQLDAASAAEYGVLLKQLIASLDAMHYEVNHGIVWCRAGGLADAAAILSAGLQSRNAIEADWFDAAKTADNAALEKILQALAAYRKASGTFPPGAVDGTLLDPETRLSWIALLLPYLGHADWYDKLERGYSWNSGQNRPITHRPLPEAINPALGPASTEAGFPVTHYVGISGVGADAGMLPASDPRAGVFGYGRALRPEEIPDGASNTIAVLGVSGRPGAWAAGGNASVRPLTKAPYVNGPDGFGSGQPNGMLAGMADGSVRFISKDVDPRVLEQLATAGGHEKATAALLAPLVPQQPLAPEQAAQADSAPEQEPEAPAAPQPSQPAESPAEAAALAAAIKAKLNVPIPSLTFSETPLRRAVTTLGDLGGVEITFDSDALADLGVSLADPVSVELQATTVGKALQASVGGAGLTCVLENGNVIVTSPNAFRQTLAAWQEKVFDLTDGKSAAAAELAAAIERLVAAETWKRNGGRGTIVAINDELSGQQTPAVVRRLSEFLDRLRIARGLSPKVFSNLGASDMQPRAVSAVEALGQPITLNYHDGASLKEIAAALEEAGEVAILIDWSALAATKTTPAAKVPLAVDQLPLGAALDALCGPIGLSWRVIDSDTFEITAPKVAAARLELEFYPVAKLAADGKTTPQAILERIQSGAAPGSWSDAGGPGAIWLDAPSGCLVVLQSQKVHAEIARILREKP